MGKEFTDSYDEAFHKEHFDSIQALRGIASLLVILVHIRFLNRNAFAVGVDIFFCISGFMIMFSTHTGPKYFLRKRLFRILPLYYLMTIGTFFLLVLFPGMFQESRANPVFLLKSLLFIPFDPGGGLIQPLMRVGWTINYEILFYIIFFLAMKISHKHRGLLCSAFLLAIISASQLLSALLPGSYAPLIFYGNPVMLEFVLGILLYHAARKLYRHFRISAFPPAFLPISMICIIGVFIGLLATDPTADVLGFYRPLLWGVPAAVIVLCTFVIGLYPVKIPSSMVRLGNASFSLYLLHYYPVMLLDRMVFDFSVCSPRALLGAVIAIAVSVAIALVSRELLEKRVSGLLCRHLLP